MYCCDSARKHRTGNDEQVVKITTIKRNISIIVTLVNQGYNKEKIIGLKSQLFYLGNYLTTKEETVKSLWCRSNLLHSSWKTD